MGGEERWEKEDQLKEQAESSRAGLESSSKSLADEMADAGDAQPHPHRRERRRGQGSTHACMCNWQPKPKPKPRTKPDRNRICALMLHKHYLVFAAAADPLRTNL